MIYTAWTYYSGAHTHLIDWSFFKWQSAEEYSHLTYVKVARSADIPVLINYGHASDFNRTAEITHVILANLKRIVNALISDLLFCFYGTAFAAVFYQIYNCVWAVWQPLYPNFHVRDSTFIHFENWFLIISLSSHLSNGAVWMCGINNLPKQLIDYRNSTRHCRKRHLRLLELVGVWVVRDWTIFKDRVTVGFEVRFQELTTVETDLKVVQLEFGIFSIVSVSFSIVLVHVFFKSREPPELFPYSPVQRVWYEGIDNY